MNIATSSSKICMVTVNYNYGIYLRDCMMSVIGQRDFDRVDYVVMDAGSTDDSVKIIEGLSPHLHYWHSKPDNGLYDGVQQGFMKSNSDYMGLAKF